MMPKILFSGLSLSLSLLVTFTPTWSAVQGVYSPTYRWTKEKTKVDESPTDPVTLTACWMQGPKYIYYDNLSSNLRVVEFDFTSMMSGVELSINASWGFYSNLKINWLPAGQFGSNCDVTVDINPEMNNMVSTKNAVGFYDGVGTNSPTRTIKINPLYFDPVSIHKLNDPAATYSGFFRPGSSGAVRILLEERASKASDIANLALRYTRNTMVHEFGHALGIYHEQCYVPNAYTGMIEGCGEGADVDYQLKNLEKFDVNSIMLYGGTKERNWDYNISCGDVMTIRQLYGRKPVPFNSLDMCYVGAEVCRDKAFPAMPKSSADPIPTTTPEGSCSQPVIDDAVFTGLPVDQKATANLTTSTTQDVSTIKEFEVMAANPVPPDFTVTNACSYVTWISPNMDINTPVQKAFIGDKVHIKVNFTADKYAQTYILYASQNNAGETYNRPTTQITSSPYYNSGAQTFELDYQVPENIVKTASTSRATSYYLSFTLAAQYYSLGPLGSTTIQYPCDSRVIWASERIKELRTVVVHQITTTTETARFGILNGVSATTGPTEPALLAGSIYPLQWAQSKQVASASFDLQLYPDKSSAKEPPVSTYRIGSWNKGEGSFVEFINVPRQYTNAAGQIVRVKGWARLKGTANVNNATNGTLIAYSLPFYIGPPAPSLDVMYPMHGNPGDLITLTGRFDNIATAQSSLTYGGNAVIIETKTESQITFKVPAVRKSGGLQLTIDGTTSNSLLFQIDPRIESIVPEHPRAGEAMLVNGYGFEFGVAPMSVTFGSLPGIWVPGTAETFQFTFYPSCGYAPGPLKISIANAAATKTITPFPVLGNMMGDAGVPGQSVTLSGEGFASNSKVSLNGNLITPTGIANSAISFIIPQGAVSGSIKIVIPATGDQTQVESNSFQFTVGPKVGTISKDYGASGDQITITGSFGLESSTRSVQIGSLICMIINSSQTSILFQIPWGHNPVSGMLSVTVAGIKSDFRPFTVMPTITSVSQVAASPMEEIRLYGFFHGTEIILKSSTTPITILDKGIALSGYDYVAFAFTGDFSATSVLMEAKRYGGAGTIPFSAVTLYPRPIVTSLKPGYGLAGDKLVLNGSHFTDDGVSPQIEFGGVAGTVLTAAVDMIEVTVPIGTGRAPVVVKRAIVGGYAQSKQIDFGYRPILASFKPNYAIRGGLLTITGQNFDPDGDIEVYIGGAKAQVLSTSTTTLVVKVNSASFGSGIQAISRRAPSDLVPLKVTANLVPVLSLLLQ